MPSRSERERRYKEHKPAYPRVRGKGSYELTLCPQARPSCIRAAVVYNGLTGRSSKEGI